MKTFPTSNSLEHASRSPDDITTTPARICNAWQDILLGSSCLIFPMTILTALLVAIVIKYGVKAEAHASPLLTQPLSANISDNALYVSVDATHLTFLVSRISSVATLLIGAGVVLASYPVAARYLRDSIQRKDTLLTPFQLALTVKFIEGSPWRALWSLLQYHLDWENHEKIYGTPLGHVATVSVFVTLLSALVFGADTWLHFATKTVQLTQFSTLPNESVLHSFIPSKACTSVNNSLAALDYASEACAVVPDPKPTQFRVPRLIDTTTSMEILNNQSSRFSVVESTDPSISYLSPAPVALDLAQDFWATTFGVRTQCSSISQACNLANNGNATFNCSSGALAVRGSEFNDAGVVMKVFKQFNLSDSGDLYRYYGVDNPFYVAAATLSFMSSKTGLGKDPAVLSYAANNSVAAVFRCTVTILDVEYTQVAGVASVKHVRPSNMSIANMFVSGWKPPGAFGRRNMMPAMDMAALHSSSAQELSDRFGAIISKVILASGVGSLNSAPVKAAQLRKDVLVAQVPKTPFVLLIIADSAFVFVGLVLTMFAICTQPDGREAQYHLTIPGLVANACDRDNVRKEASNVNHLFGEYHAVADAGRVGYNRTSRNGLVLENFSQQTRTSNTNRTQQPLDPIEERRQHTTTSSTNMVHNLSQGNFSADYLLYMRDSRAWV